MVLLGYILLSLSIRVLTPAGYMPMPLAGDGPIALCPGGLPSDTFSASLGHAAHGNHEDHGDHANGGDGEPQKHKNHHVEICPVGALLGSAAAPTYDVTVSVPLNATSLQVADIGSDFISIALPSYSARGPPQTPQFCS